MTRTNHTVPETTGSDIDKFPDDETVRMESDEDEVKDENEDEDEENNLFIDNFDDYTREELVKKYKKFIKVFTSVEEHYVSQIDEMHQDRFDGLVGKFKRPLRYRVRSRTFPNNIKKYVREVSFMLMDGSRNQKTLKFKTARTEVMAVRHVAKYFSSPINVEQWNRLKAKKFVKNGFKASDDLRYCGIGRNLEGNENHIQVKLLNDIDLNFLDTFLS
jgi:hypothetical protein